MNDKSRHKSATSLPDAFPAPAPMELAKLAAMVARGSTPEKALPRAMKLYVEAVLFRNDLPRDLGSIIGTYGSNEREFKWLQEHVPGQKKFKLEWSKVGDDADEARRYLKAKGLPIKLAESVLKNFRRSWRYTGRDDADAVIASWESTGKGQKIYVIPERFLSGVATIARQRRSETRAKAWQARKK